jgi:hypothetical protein
MFHGGMFKRSSICCATGDRRWMLVLEGQGSDYHGEAVNPANLSLFELALGYHKVRAAF